MRPTSPLVPFALLTALCAQNDFDLDKATAGTLGGTLTLQVRQAPANSLLLVMFSQNAGPTAIAPFDPADPRSVQVGLDLVGNWYLSFTDGAGAVGIHTPLPADPAFQGSVLHWQCAALPGTSTVLGPISNAVTTHSTLPATSAPLPNPLANARAAATVCWNRTRNAGQGDLLLAGGATTEFFRFRTLDSAPGPTMVTPRAGHAAATLNDGRVLFTGGIDGTGAVTTACEVYDPATDMFTAVASLLGPRTGHAAATLPDGRVMVVGGTINFTDLTIALTGALNTTEIWNPTTNTWTAGPNLGGRRLVPALTRLSTGRMLVTGGVEVTLFLGIPIAVASTNRAQLYNPATNSWSNAANMPAGRAWHHDNQVTLADGRVLFTGGILVPDLLNAANSAPIANADVYNPTTNTWLATTMSQARTAHSATRLADGRVIVCGGAQGLLSTPVAIAAVASFDPASNAWTDLAPLSAPRAGHVGVLLPDGLLALLGGGTTGEALHF